jgi:hypothetical protein
MALLTSWPPRRGASRGLCEGLGLPSSATLGSLGTIRGPLRWAGVGIGLTALLAACGAAGKGASPPPASPTTASPPPTATTTPTPSQTSTSLSAARRPTSSSRVGPPSSVARPPTTVARPTTTVARPPTTAKPWAPAAPQPTSSQAAFALVDAWAAKDRPEALRDAAPSAVGHLFSYTYPAGGAQFRGCSTPPGNAPAACVWRVGNDLLSLTVRAWPRGWAVTAATMES